MELQISDRFFSEYFYPVFNSCVRFEISLYSDVLNQHKTASRRFWIKFREVQRSSRPT